MKYVLGIAAFGCLIAGTSFADEVPTPKPFVSLSQDQLERLIQAETAKAVGQYMVQEKVAAAKESYEAIGKAFAPQPKK